PITEALCKVSARFTYTRSLALRPAWDVFCALFTRETGLRFPELDSSRNRVRKIEDILDVIDDTFSISSGIFPSLVLRCFQSLSRMQQIPSCYALKQSVTEEHISVESHSSL